MFRRGQRSQHSIPGCHASLDSPILRFAPLSHLQADTHGRREEHDGPPTRTEGPKPRFAASHSQQPPIWPSATGTGVGAATDQRTA
jgi:hypothetical protein